MLARGDRRHRNLDVSGGSREVHDDLHVRMRKNVVGRPPSGHTVLLGLRAGALDVEVADDDDLDIGEGSEVLEIGVADDPAADQADADRGHWTNPPSRRKARLAATSSKTSPGGLSYSMTAYRMAPAPALSASARGT